jgi:hypothetical protein
VCAAHARELDSTHCRQEWTDKERDFLRMSEWKKTGSMALLLGVAAAQSSAVIELTSKWLGRTRATQALLLGMGGAAVLCLKLLFEGGTAGSALGLGLAAKGDPRAAELLSALKRSSPALDFDQLMSEAWTSEAKNVQRALKFFPDAPSRKQPRLAEETPPPARDRPPPPAGADQDEWRQALDASPAGLVGMRVVRLLWWESTMGLLGAHKTSIGDEDHAAAKRAAAEAEEELRHLRAAAELDRVAASAREKVGDDRR